MTYPILQQIFALSNLKFFSFPKKLLLKLFFFQFFEKLKIWSQKSF